MGHVERNDSLAKRYGVALQRYEFAIKHLKIEDKVIDLGCGMGYGCHLIRKAGFQVYGVDYSQEAVDYCRVTYPEVEYSVVDLEAKNDFSNFNVATCMETLCHLKDPQKFVDGITQERLIVSAAIDPNPNDGYHFRLHNLSEEQFKGLFKDWKIEAELKQKKYMVLYLVKKPLE